MSSPTRLDRNSRGTLVVYGRDEKAKDAVFSLLRKLGLHPLEWEDVVRATAASAPPLNEVIAAATHIAQAAIVLLTPDDIVMLHPALRKGDEPAHEVQPTGQPSPNVLLELGMLFAAFPDQTIVVEIGDVRRVSHLAARNVVRFDGTAASIDEIVRRLKLAGSPVLLQAEVDQQSDL